MIAYRCHYEPTNLRAVQLIREGSLGKIQAIESGVRFNIAAGEWRLDKKLAGGGPLMDVGIYSLNACRYLTGEEAGKAFRNLVGNRWRRRFKDVEENVSWTMKFPSGVVASCNTTYGAPMPGFYRCTDRKACSKWTTRSAMKASFNGENRGQTGDRRAQHRARPLALRPRGRSLCAMHSGK